MSIRKRTWTTKKGERKEAWVVDYKDSQGRRAIKTFQRKKDAEAWWNGRASYEVAQGLHTPASRSITIKEAAANWQRHGRLQDPPLERSTLEQRRQHCDLHIVPFLGDVKLSDLTTPRVRDYLDRLREEGRSLAMRRKVLTSLKSLLSFCQTRGDVMQNVAVPIRLTSRMQEREARDIHNEIPSKAKLRLMMEKAPAKWRPFIVTAIFTGMRASELRGLAWQHVDLDDGLIRVRQRADAWLQIGPPKSQAGSRDIPLAPMAVNALREWKLVYPRPIIGRDEKGKPIREAHKPEHLVFPNSRGNVETHGNIWKRFFAPLQMDNGMTYDTGKKDEEGKPIMAPKWGLHALRHAAASLFIEQGWPPKKVQTVMGHSSIQMTYDLYGKLWKDAESDRQAVERMQAALLKE